MTGKRAKNHDKNGIEKKADIFCRYEFKIV